VTAQTGRITCTTCPTCITSLDGIEPSTSLQSIASLPTAAVQKSIPLTRPDLTLSPTDLEMLLHGHDDVAAVVPVHLHGLLCNVDEIHDVVNEAASRHSWPIAVVYDSAHAFGSSVHGKPVGVFGTAEVFSFSESTPLVSILDHVVDALAEALAIVTRRPHEGVLLERPE
jgi:hypothetical protein